MIRGQPAVKSGAVREFQPARDSGAAREARGWGLLRDVSVAREQVGTGSHPCRSVSTMARAITDLFVSMKASACH
jgi:hypothetical protein